MRALIKALVRNLPESGAQHRFDQNLMDDPRGSHGAIYVYQEGQRVDYTRSN